MSSLVTIDLDQVHKDRQELANRRAEIDAKLSALEALEEAAQKYAATINGKRPKRKKAGITRFVKPTAKPSADEKPFYETLEAILRNAGHAMKTKEITAVVLADDSSKSKVKNLETSVFTAMRRRTDVFEKAGPGLWRLKGAARKTTASDPLDL